MTYYEGNLSHLHQTVSNSGLGKPKVESRELCSGQNFWQKPTQHGCKTRIDTRYLRPHTDQRSHQTYICVIGCLSLIATTAEQ